ncbi:MAG: ammonium transporter [Thermodesulfobacteriota bacterium]
MRLSSLTTRFSVVRYFLVSLFLGLIISSDALAAEGAGKIDSGDTAWILVSTALVMFMTPGLAIFYAGMTRSKNVLGTIMQSFFILCLISVQWVLFGYSLSFGTDVGGIIGSLNYLALNGVGMEANGTIPHILFMMFQGMFAIITVALITGAMAERVKFSAVIIFSLLWATLIYDPLCHWVWGGGWLGELGALDFAGGIVVHISCGVSALVAALVLGKRKGFPRTPMPPHNLVLTVVGMGVLWFGWFGFNAGSALAANGNAAMALVTTNTAAAVGTLTWVFIEWIHRGKPTVLGAVSGAVAGLGSITPASGFIGPSSAMIIGFVGGLICYSAVTILKPRLSYDDSLDVFGIHGIGGIWGTLSIGLFATIGAKGLFTGDPSQLSKQFIAVIVTIVFCGVGTYIILKVVDKLVGLRVTEEDEVIGLDQTQHGESGYTS